MAKDIKDIMRDTMDADRAITKDMAREKELVIDANKKQKKILGF